MRVAGFEDADAKAACEQLGYEAGAIAGDGGPAAPAQPRALSSGATRFSRAAYVACSDDVAGANSLGQPRTHVPSFPALLPHLAWPCVDIAYGDGVTVRPVATTAMPSLL